MAFPFDPGGPAIPPIPPFGPLGPIFPIPPIPPILPFPESVPLAPVQRRPKDVAKYFLPPENQSDDMLFRGAVRDALSVTPIVDGEEIFAALERAIEGAKKSVLIAFWAFDPGMKMVTDSDTTWLEMLVNAAKDRNVLVRVFMNDFDPALQPVPHLQAWGRFFQMLRETASIPVDKFQVVCSPHEAEIGAALVQQFKNDLWAGLAAELNKIPNPDDRIRKFGAMPGTWEKLDFQTSDKKIVEKVKGKSYPAWPAVHHQKLVLIDSKLAFVGGVNVTDGYRDTRKHDKPELPWHDVFVQVEGSGFLVKDFERNYMGLWNQERKRMEAFLQAAKKALNVKGNIISRPVTDLTPKDLGSSAAPATIPKIPCQVHRTISRKGNDPKGIPVTKRQDILDGYLAAIGEAEQYVYLENQYFREAAIADALIARHKEKPNLRTILLIPKVIEEFLQGQGDILSKHGAALQFELLGRMKDKIGAALGLFALERADGKLIYVHSKLLLVDDKFGSIGSANCNPRSFRIDTELDFTWLDATVVKNLRMNLWNEALGNPPMMNSWRPKDYVAKWTEIAKRNAKVTGAARKGFAIPFENTTKGDKQNVLELLVNISSWV
jgi:phosphatidylserine/phosphatidylglycerophosphate/cardiolipin synthase-like enzyme